MVVVTETNGTRNKIALGFSGAVVIALIGWNFATVQTLQVTMGAQEQRIMGIRAELDALRQNDTNFQAEMRLSAAATQEETRKSIGHVSDIITELRVHISDLLVTIHGGKR